MWFGNHGMRAFPERSSAAPVTSWEWNHQNCSIATGQSRRSSLVLMVLLKYLPSIATCLPSKGVPWLLGMSLRDTHFHPTSRGLCSLMAKIDRSGATLFPLDGTHMTWCQVQPKYKMFEVPVPGPQGICSGVSFCCCSGWKGTAFVSLDRHNEVPEMGGLNHRNLLSYGSADQMSNIKVQVYWIRAYPSDLFGPWLPLWRPCVQMCSHSEVMGFTTSTWRFCEERMYFSL